MDWQWTGVGLAQDLPWIRTQLDGLTSDWGWIGTGLATD
jgi:hypothetical protein